MGRKFFIRTLLAVLNSRWLNPTPCRYGFIGNVDAFALENLRAQVDQRPTLTVAQLIQEADCFRRAKASRHRLVVIEGGVSRDGTPRDVADLLEALTEGRGYRDATGYVGVSGKNPER